jgi:hypothetical protein
MKNITLLFALVLMSSTQAHAGLSVQEGDLIDVNSEQEQILAEINPLELIPVKGGADEMPSNLKILGKGILNRDTGASLATACVGPADESAEPLCNLLRVVEFDENHVPHWQGPAFAISSAESFQVALKKEYRKKYRLHFLKMKKKAVRTERIAAVIGFSFVLGGALFSKTINAMVIPALAGGGWTFVAVPAAVLILLSIASAYDVDVVAAPVNLVMAPFRGLGNAMVMDGSTSMTANDGWNWAERPAEVSNKKYGKIKALLLDFAK